MPCFTMSSMETTLEAKDPATLKAALEEMGFAVREIAGQINFSGRNKETGRYEEGSYIDGVLTASKTLSVNSVKKSYAVQVAAQAAKKMGFKFGQLPNGTYVTYQ